MNDSNYPQDLLYDEWSGFSIKFIEDKWINYCMMNDLDLFVQTPHWRWMMEDRRWKMKDERWKMTDDRWKLLKMNDLNSP